MMTLHTAAGLTHKDMQKINAHTCIKVTDAYIRQWKDNEQYEGCLMMVRNYLDAGVRPVNASGNIYTYVLYLLSEINN